MKLNLNDSNQLKTLLKHDKPVVLEGMIVENIFIKDVIVKRDRLNLNNLSLGWWSVKFKNEFILFKMSDKPLTQTDIKVFQYLGKINIRTYFCKINENGDLKFADINKNIIENNLYNFMDELEFKNLLGMKKVNESLDASKNLKDINRQYEVIDFFCRHNMLRDIAIQRYFANFFLTVYFNNLLNIDGFIMKDNNLYIYEIKYKYVSRKNEFGINKGQAEVFKHFISKNISVINCILEKPKKDEKLTILNLMKNNELKLKTKWIYHYLNYDELNGIKEAPRKTSIDGKKTQKYIGIDRSKYKYLKNLDV